MGIRIVVDSSADLIPQVRERVVVVPLTVHFGDREFIDGVDITGCRFYEMLETAKVLPTTSQASPYAFSAAFGQAVADGDEVIAIAVSSKLSGTYQSACIAKEMTEYDGIYIIDSKAATYLIAILAKYARDLVEQGLYFEIYADSENCLAWMETYGLRQLLDNQFADDR